jgi:2'-5' RNA ligase
MDNASPPSDSFTLCHVRRDFAEWHLGRQHYALWALQVDTAPVRQRVQGAQAHLAQYLLAGYQRQPHITVGLCGFPSATPRYNDDFGLDTLRTQLAALRRAPPGPFGIQVRGLDSFTSVPYLSVQADAGRLDALRLCLAKGHMNLAPSHYTPHVTVGLYAGVWPLSALQAHFNHFTNSEALPLRIHGISLMSYAASEIGGPLQTLAGYDFESGALRWSSKLPAELQAFTAIR